MHAPDPDRSNFLNPLLNPDSEKPLQELSFDPSRAEQPFDPSVFQTGALAGLGAFSLPPPVQPGS